jgi:hypothetical protein
MHRRSTGMMVTGAILTGVGGLGILIGAVVVGTATRQCTAYDAGYIGPVDCSDEDQQLAGAITMIAGGALLAVGIPLLVIGAKKVPVTESEQPTEASLRPTVSLGPGSGRVRWSF